MRALNDSLREIELPKSVMDEQAPVDVSYLAFTLAFMVKPVNVLETGTGMGNVAVSILRALAQVGKGTLWTVESDPQLAHFANTAFVEERDFAPDIHFDPRLVPMSSHEFEPPDDVKFDLCWFDTGNAVGEFDHFFRWMREGTVVVFVNPGGQVSDHVNEIREVSVSPTIHIAEVVL